MPAVPYPAKLEELVQLFDDLPRQERIDMLLEFANALPEVPEHLKLDEAKRQPVHECLTPTWVYVEPRGESADIYVEVGESAPTIKAVAAVIIEGSQGAPRSEILSIPPELPVRIIGPEMVGQRRFGLAALVNHIKRAVAQVDRPAG
jgi:cysteine desulfuration protein SufE